MARGYTSSFSLALLCLPALVGIWIRAVSAQAPQQREVVARVALVGVGTGLFSGVVTGTDVKGAVVISAYELPVVATVEFSGLDVSGTVFTKNGDVLGTFDGGPSGAEMRGSFSLSPAGREILPSSSPLAKGEASGTANGASSPPIGMWTASTVSIVGTEPAPRMDARQQTRAVGE